MKNLKEFFKNDKFAAHSGIELLEVSEGRSKARMVLKEQHWNGISIVHGGAIFTLADFAFAAAANSHGTVAIAINVNISFVKAMQTGVLTAEAQEVTRNSKLGTYNVLVRDENQELVAIFQGMAYRKKDKLPLPPS